ncbi:tetratricopeptide repeat protein [Winogradskyella luteola]|uniref:Tetratricopeptide repeat protein n=1 Tax=Winogradskyella luteola TaxID=2828330 RepID=A0A9X1JNY1_9FLAO|nr:tetratricopeptide repeat protein [Winogradskyella luteola]MBV7269876.1 hypothetical protein [Winogradskyella luteola]
MDINDISQEEFEKIEAYINGQLSNEDLLEFENRLKNENHLATKVEDIKIVLTGLETQTMKEQLDEFHNELSSNQDKTVVNQPKVRRFNWKRIAVAAILIIGLGSFWLFGGSSNERLYAKYFTPDPGLPTTMGSNDNYEFYEAMVDYKQGDYKGAISKWESLRNLKPQSDTLNYFIGVAHLASKNEKIAISFLEDASKNPEFALKNDAHYYLGLAYLKAGNTKQAKVNLKKSSSENSKEILAKIE